MSARPVTTILGDAWTLARLNRDGRPHEGGSERMQQLMTELEQATRDLGELAEAEREFDAAQAWHDECASYDSEGASVPRAVYARMEAATARRAAALARVGGAA